MDIRHIEEKTKELKAQSLPLVQAVEKTQALVNELSTKLENMKVDKQQPDIDATLAQMAKERDARVLLDELTEHLTKQKEALHQFWNNEETSYSIRAEANRSQEYLSPTESQLIEGLIDNILDVKTRKQIKVEFRESTTFERLSPSVLQMCSLLELTEEQINEMWELGLTL